MVWDWRKEKLKLPGLNLRSKWGNTSGFSPFAFLTFPRCHLGSLPEFLQNRIGYPVDKAGFAKDCKALCSIY